MELIDKNYLKLQFWNKVYKKNATEFQSFFEEIMQRAYSDFQKIRPYGDQGDRGNDGYRPSEGIYYQAYAPNNPNEKEAKAAKKLRKDFEKLKTSWDQISKIKAFNFVFNDKGAGVSIEIEKALAELKTNNENIGFKKLTPKDLENIFFSLKKEEMLALGFDIDSTNALRIAQEYLDKLEVDLDRENGKFVLKALENFKNILEDLQDESLQLTYELLGARALQKVERTIEAKEKYLNLCIRYPNDPRSFLYLAEIYLGNEDFEKNEELLIQAGNINGSHWLLASNKLIREYQLGNQIDIEDINDQAFPSNPRIKSNFYRIHSLFLERAGDVTKAKSFIERAIHLNPERVANYITKLSILGNCITSKNTDRRKFQQDVNNYLTEIEAVEEKTTELGELSIRDKALINSMKLYVFRLQENTVEIEKIAKESFELLIRCYFDSLIDKLFFSLLMLIQFPSKDFEILLKYLQNAGKSISDDLAKALVLQFNFKNKLFTDGKAFFEATKKKMICDFIENLKNEEYDAVWVFLKDDLQFSVGVANSFKRFPVLRKKIIERLPNDGNIEKEKLLLLLNYDEKNFNEAFDLLKGFDLSKLSYFECRPILEIAKEKKAWDFEIIVLEKLLQYEKDNNAALQLKLQLFTASLNLGKLPESIQIGEKILSNSNEIELLDDQDKEYLFGNTILAKMKRGEYQDAKVLMEKYPSLSITSRFKLSIEAEVYLKNKDAHKALESVVAGIKIQKSPTPEEYGNLYMFFLEVDKLIGFPLDSLESIKANCFVKFKNEERWYFIGDENELDATKISSSNEKYSKFLDRNIDEKIVFDDKYRSDKTEYSIENILTIEKYINWQCVQHAEKLTLERRWDLMEAIEIPKIGEIIDTKYLVSWLEDKTKHPAMFDIYCQGNFPLAILAHQMGGLTNAIGCIFNENKGFIKFSYGDITETNQQKDIARKIITGGPFYIDGTSALVLSETGLLEKIYEYLPNLNVPQSVITFLLGIKEKFRYIPGQVGHISLVQGKLKFSSVDLEKRTTLEKTFENCIKLLESKPQNIYAISSANKSEDLIEQVLPSELCDACILARKDNVIVLTDDLLYLQVNEHETNKKAPEYCSTFALIKVLYEQKKIVFDEYLNFFTYLSSYRFRFLPITVEDIEKAIFGDENIKIEQPERIRQFNFPLTLSEEYGVPFDVAFRVVGQFLIRVLVNDAILPETTERIFSEILSAFPTDKDKNTLGKMFLRESVQTINKKRQEIIIGTRVQEKIDLLSQSTEIYGLKNLLWTP